MLFIRTVLLSRIYLARASRAAQPGNGLMWLSAGKKYFQLAAS